MIVDTIERLLTPYKGYQITKIQDVTSAGKKINTNYSVSDEENIIDVFTTLNEAKKYIDTILL